jgi:membrane-associated phospholipid phosphatase
VASLVMPVILPVLGAAVYVCLFATLGRFANWKRLYAGFVITTLFSVALTHLLKIAIGRARPIAERGPLAFEPFSAGQYLDAFPSGHTAFAVTAALLLGRYFPHGRPYFYFLAACVALERIVVGWHYATDTIAGAGVAIIAVTLCRRWLGPTFFTCQTPGGAPRGRGV